MVEGITSSFHVCLTLWWPKQSVLVGSWPSKICGQPEEKKHFLGCYCPVGYNMPWKGIMGNEGLQGVLGWSRVSELAAMSTDCVPLMLRGFFRHLTWGLPPHCQRWLKQLCLRPHYKVTPTLQYVFSKLSFLRPGYCSTPKWMRATELGLGVPWLKHSLHFMSRLRAEHGTLGG